MATKKYSGFTVKSPPLTADSVMGLDSVAVPAGQKNIAIPLSNFALINSANTFGDFLTTFKDNKLKINSPDDADGVTFVNSNQTAERNLTIPILVGDDTIVTLATAQAITGAKTFTANVAITDVDVILSATTGTKIATAATQKLAFWNTTPVVQPAHIVDADGTLADITTKFNTLLAQMATTGLQAAS